MLPSYGMESTLDKSEDTKKRTEDFKFSSLFLLLASRLHTNVLIHPAVTAHIN